MLRKVLSILFVLLITAGLFMQEADARRFGGGRSFGISRPSSSYNHASPSQNAYRQQPYGQTASPMSRWMGPLAGLAVGGLLASLFMHNGIGSGILSWLLIGGLFFVLLSFFRNRMQPKPSYRQDHMNHFASQNAAFHERSYSAPAKNYPIGFDAPIFLRDAKAQYIRLQAAYDQKNINDIREFTTPEVFAEIQLQFQERGIVENKTDVLSLEAELLNIDAQSQNISGTEMQGLLATVRFNGLIQEDRELPAENISEIWHFKREVGSLRWLVAGVQQS
jgi:predicted lipid-binding transport protein (Tim44 family)